MQGHPCPATTQSCRRAAPAPWCPPAPYALWHGWRVQAAARGPVLQRAAFCPPPHATATSHTARHQPHRLCPCPCSSFGMLPPALGQWVQATAAPETQFQLLRVWGEKKYFCTSVRNISGCQRELCVHWQSVTLARWLCLLQDSGVSHCPRSGEPGPCSLPHSLSSEDKQVTIHHQPLLC